MRRITHIQYRIFILCCTYCLIYTSKNTVWAQENRYTLNTVIKTATIKTKADSVRIDLLIQASRKITFTNPDSALVLAQRALAISQHTQNSRYIAASLMALSVVFEDGKDDFKQSRAMLLGAAKYAPDLSPNDNLLPSLFLDIGNNYYEQAMYDSACYFFFNALRILGEQKNRDTQNLMTCYANIGTCFIHTEQLEHSLYYLNKSLQLALLRKDTAMMAFTYCGIGEAYDAKNNNDSAIKYMLLALRPFLRISDTYNVIETYAILGQLFENKKDFYKAGQYYDSARFLDRTELKHNSTLLACLGKLNYEEGNYQKAAFYLKQSLNYFKQKIHRAARLEIYQSLNKTYQKLRDYKQAYYYQNSYIILSDSIQKEKSDNAINQLEVKYRTSEKDKELVSQKLQLASTSNRLKSNQIWIIGSVAVSLILIISSISLFQKQRMQLQKVHISSQQLKMAQLKAAIEGEEKERSRIGRQLHDDIMVQLSVIKMGLNVLPMKYPGFEHTEDYKNLLQQLNYTSQNIRQTAHNLMPDAILAEGLIPAVSYFCNDIMRLAQLQIRIQYYGLVLRLPADIEVCVYRIIQELIQNIIKHAKAKSALIQFNFRPNVLSITIEDDGVGFALDANDQDNKMGLKSVRSRLEAINALFDIHQCQPHGTSVNITLNI